MWLKIPQLSSKLSCKEEDLAEKFLRYLHANIPLKYWQMEMQNFEGHVSLNNLFERLVGDIEKIRETYDKGTSIKFSGNLGLGKTYVTCNILKQVVNSGLYSALYVTLDDVISQLVYGKSETKSLSRYLLLNRDFLVIDEFDPRYAASGLGNDLFARLLENIFRPRNNNQLPTFICTNSPNFLESVENGMLKASLASILNYMEDCFLPPGKDFRKNKK